MSINVDPFGNYLVYYNPPPPHFPAYPTTSPVPMSNQFPQALTGFNIPQGQANPDAYTYLTGYYIHANDFTFSPNIYAAPQFWNGYPAIQNWFGENFFHSRQTSKLTQDGIAFIPITLTPSHSSQSTTMFVYKLHLLLKKVIILIIFWAAHFPLLLTYFYISCHACAGQWYLLFESGLVINMHLCVRLWTCTQPPSYSPR